MKRLALYCLFTTLFAAESAYLLPHRWQDARPSWTPSAPGSRTA